GAEEAGGAADFAAQGSRQFRSQKIAARFAGDQHDAARAHPPRAAAGVFSWINRVISKAKSRASLADSPLTLGVCRARTHWMKWISSSLSGSSLVIGTGSRTIRFPANSLTIIVSLDASSFFSNELSSSWSRAIR